MKDVTEVKYFQAKCPICGETFIEFEQGLAEREADKHRGKCPLYKVLRIIHPNLPEYPTIKL